MASMTAHQPSGITSSASSAPTPNNVQRTVGVARHLKRALLISGVVSLILGIATGIFEANPDPLSSWLHLDPQTIQVSGVALAGMALIGLVSGVLIGFSLRSRTFLLRLSASLVVILVGWLASVLSQGFLLGLVLHDSMIRSGDLLAFGQLELGIIGALISLLVLRRIYRVQPGRVSSGALRALPSADQNDTHPRNPLRSASAEAVPATGAANSPSPSSASVSPIALTSTDSGHRANRTNRSTRKTRSNRDRANAGNAGSSASAASASTPGGNANRPIKIKRPAPKPQSQRWQLWRRRSPGLRKAIHLNKDVVEVCPYCFEEVKRGDPRGRVVCKICGTAHHGDCWAVAGRCQVPHLQS